MGREGNRYSFYDEDPFDQSYLSSKQLDVSPQFSDSLMKTATSPYASAAAAPFMATPAGAAVAVGSQFLTQYLAQQAADARAKRERDAQIAQEQGRSEQSAYDRLTNVYRSALS
jgi:hypothetical protein